MSPAADSSAARQRVTAVIVSHDGAPWLPHLLSSLDASTRGPDEVVAVDTGSRDVSVRLLTAALGAQHVLEIEPAAGFGAAVTAGIAAADGQALARRGRHAADQAPAEEWVWLLHDDAAPAPQALEQLLEIAVTDPLIAAVGCRVRSWPRGRRLLEVGVTISGTGHRETGLEPGEYDQGQHDQVRDVLAVSTAGMLVRRSAWDALGGLDPRLPLFRDDVDFGWRAAAAGYRVVIAPPAVVFHAEAASRGLRASAITAAHPHRADRRAAVLTLLANASPAALPFAFLRLLLGSLLRAVVYLLGKAPRAAWDEVAGSAAVLARPDRLVDARRWRRRQRTSRPVSVRRLRPPWWAPYTRALETSVSRISESLRTAGESQPRSHGEREVLAGRAWERHPALLLAALLAFAGAVASRGLWGSGFLQGGALLPAPDSAGSWWRLLVEGSHPVGLGSDADPAPYVGLLALPASLLFGKAWLLVDLLMLFAPLLAGLGGWVAAGRLVEGRAVRWWMALGYGLVPVVTGAVASGHLGTVVVAVLLPWVARSAIRILDPLAPGRWGSAWATGLALSVATAFAPACWAIFVGLGLVATTWLALRAKWARVAQWLLATALPLALLAPWSWRVLTHPDLALTEAGIVDVSGSAPAQPGWHLLFLRIGATGQAPWWISAGILAVAVAALLRADTRARVAAAWLVAAAGFVAAAVMGRDPVPAALGLGQAYPWLGVPIVVSSAGLIAAGGIAGDGLRSYVRSGSFGWRQPLAAVVAVVGVLTPALALVWWVGWASHGDLRRTAAVPVPAYMAEDMSNAAAKVLVLRTGGQTVRYHVLAGDGDRLGDDSVLPRAADPGLTAAVRDLVSQGRAEDAAALADRGIRYVVLVAPQNPRVVNLLDGLDGLTRTSTEESVRSGWQLSSADDSVDSDGGTDPSRERWLIVAAAAWGLVVVLAAPGSRRRQLPAHGGSR